ncbi:hypothetical protein [Streptomyces sp. NPDC096339]|uniref:hypothetical protein n=1 Tax=Streptomyces sp. NPDC096339 TaxID=3366086 RepID=UPI0038069720
MTRRTDDRLGAAERGENLHGHVHPRYQWEPPELLHGPVWRYGKERTAPEHRFGPRHEALRSAIAHALTAVLAEAYEGF